MSDPGACIAFKPKRTFTAYIADTGRISVISETATPIDSIITEQPHTPLTTYESSPIFISPYNTVSQMPRSHLDPLLELFQCNRHIKLGIVFGISLLDFSANVTNLCSLVPHYLNSVMT